MAAKPKLKLVSRFPAVKEGAYDAINHAVNHALGVGQTEAERRLDQIDNTRGYALPATVGEERIGHQSGRIFYEPWYGRFFEYGTVYIEAFPFMRPAHRKMRKVFLDDMDGTVEKFISRRVRL